MSRCSSDLVGGMQGFGDLVDDAHRAGRFQRPVGLHGLQVAALDQPHTHERSTVDLPIVMDRDHVRGVQSCRRVGFAAESPLKILILRQRPVRLRWSPRWGASVGDLADHRRSADHAAHDDASLAAGSGDVFVVAAAVSVTWGRASFGSASSLSSDAS